MKKNLSASLLGIIMGFVVLQSLYFRQFGFSFLEYISWIDKWYIIRIISVFSIILGIWMTIKLFNKRRFLIEFTIMQLIFFFLGVISLAITYILWRVFSPDGDDYKFTPYVVLPCFYFISLASFYLLVFINMRPNQQLKLTK